MRGVFLAVALLNALYFGWQLLAPEREPANTSSSATQAHIPEGAQSIVLLSEAMHEAHQQNPRAAVLAARAMPEGMDSAVGSVQSMAGREADESEPASQAAETQCRAFGPFLQAAEARRFQELLDRLEVANSLQAETLATAPRYWAYIEPQANLQVALLLLGRLKSQGVSAYLISEGELINGLSLGVFNQPSEVEALVRRLSDPSPEVKISQSEGEYEEFWVLIAPASNARLDDNNLREIMSFSPGLKQRQKVCKPVASPG